MKPAFHTFCAIALTLALAFTSAADDWIHLPPKEGSANGKKIVFVTGDDEYKSETSMPMMAHILAERHGFDCTVLFAINRKTGVIDTNQRDHIPGLEALADADLMVIFTRFRTLVDEEMEMIQDYLDSGRPVIGIRSSTHAFDFSKKPDSPFAKFSYSNRSDDDTGGFGRQVLGQNWIAHWGGHGRQATRGRFAPDMADHPILRGIADGEIWGPTDVYEATLPQPEGCQAILLGEVCESMNPDAGPAPAPPEGAKGRQTINKNDPMMPIAWTYRRDVGAKGRVFASTIGGAMAGKDDWANEGMRRLFVNACFWTLEMEDQIPAKADVTPVLQPNPFKRGVKPEVALKQGLAQLEKGKNTILFYGNSMVERLLEHGEMEARLQIAQPDAGLRIRSLAWTGDEVGNRLRLEGYAKHMKNLLAEWPAKTIVLGYGLNESFAGEAGLTDFRQQYKAHLDQLARIHPGSRVVMLSPIAIEGADTARQVEVELYSKAIAELAAENDAAFVDLLSLTRQSDKQLTANGIHLNDHGNQIVAQKIAESLADLRGLSSSDVSSVDPAHLHEVALAASAKQYRIAEVVRAKNGVVYFGVRARLDEYAAEMPRYHEMIRLTEAVVHQLARDPKKTFASIPAPSLPPMPEGKGRDDGKKTGIIKTVAENQAEFKTAEGYEVSLFASEEQFPELRNPVQIAFDARGRLWVVTMPSFPHTVPGLTPPDKIIILEDTDQDGKADKLTPFVEGLDALDGIAFHHDGVIISEQPRLWLMQDTDGDDRADTKTELLRGIDVTDSHHGGMIQTDPLGALIFSDGVFHRSQFETPHGVHRAMDASTYRLDIRTGKIITEWQHTTPNPWNVTFDRWGNVFQMYGDGDVYDGTSLIWTPFGAYHPYAYARITSYGKGSGCAMISSPNFPDEYQNGIASASLLGRYAVTLTKLDRSGGMVKREDSLTILESPNAAFRPADVEFAMDGSLYISDFCSPIIGHAQHPMRDPHWDHDYGRIWRVVHTKKPLNKEQPQIEGASVASLCELLTHPQDLVRHHVRIELRKHGAKGLQAVDQWIAGLNRNDADFDQAALEAIFVCEGLRETRPALIDHLLKSESDLYRAAAVHVIRIQADRLSKVKEQLASVVNDPHPRVQMEVIDAVAHLRPTHPEIENVLAELVPKDDTVKKSLAYLDYGIEPAKGRSVPVLEVARNSQITQWLWLGENGETAAVEMQVGKNKLPGLGLFRTFIHSDRPQPAIIAINSKSVDIRLNDSVVFSQDSLWSGDQQVNVELIPGLNVIEIHLKKGRRSAKTMPPVYLYDPVGQELSGAEYIRDIDALRSTAAGYDKLLAERGNVVHLQAAAGLQFTPKQLRVTPGSKVRLVFTNPDILMHNWVLLTPGSVDEIGALADQLASQADGIVKGYLPESDKILHASKLLGPNAKEEIVFNAPEEPGDYPYICTFPGHWRIMQGVLTVAKPTDRPTSKPESKLVSSDGVIIESAASPDGFKALKPSATPGARATANRKTNNDPIATLTDGRLSKAFGPIFGNGITDGAYKMDLGSVKSVSAITSWSFNMGGRRGAQKVTLYGSNAATDPGWDLSKLTRLGAIDTTGTKTANFTAASLRTKDGATLGNFRWIVWSVAPVNEAGGGENTAFQELAVETGQGAEKQAKPIPRKRSKRTSSEPNIILVMTDDQGWGEVGFHGNETLKTPNLDRFAAEGTELLNFYVSPMCTPTRSSLMTGRYHFRTGAHDTFIGRSSMRPQETTIAEIFADAGYRTGIFGKWHLGENYPMRAQDQGFQNVVVHGGGGIGQFADYPGNTYWNPTLLYNDEFKESEGYCTDVFIDESIRFIQENRDRPFYCYLPLNIPHSPFDVHEEYYQPYEKQGVKDKGGRQWTTKIYGMITQFDGAFQRLLDAVDKMGLKENTIVIFMTDNGPNSTYFTAGLRAKKGSVYENGFRSPFVIQWPKAIEGGRKFNDPAMHIDLLPTLADAAGIELPAGLEIDGQSILPLLTGEEKELPERYLFMQHNRANIPDRYRNFMVRKGPFKVVQGVGASFTPAPKNPTYELFNIHQDPGEKTNVAGKHPAMVKDFVSQYETWFTDVTAEMRKNGGAPHPYELNPIQKQPYRFTWQCWFGPDAHWKSTAYGRWTMSNPGLIERFDVTVIPQRQHHGKPATMKFIWQGETIEKTFDKIPPEIVLEDIALKNGAGFMEAQLLVNEKKWGVKEVQVEPHSSGS